MNPSFCLISFTLTTTHNKIIFGNEALRLECYYLVLIRQLPRILPNKSTFLSSKSVHLLDFIFLELDHPLRTDSIRRGDTHNCQTCGTSILFVFLFRSSIHSSDSLHSFNKLSLFNRRKTSVSLLFGPCRKCTSCSS